MIWTILVTIYATGFVFTIYIVEWQFYRSLGFNLANIFITATIWPLFLIIAHMLP